MTLEPEALAARADDNERRSWLKIAALTSQVYAEGQNAPETGDSVRVLAHKTAKSLEAATH